jgi:hypothetical protein
MAADAAVGVAVDLIAVDLCGIVGGCIANARLRRTSLFSWFASGGGRGSSSSAVMPRIASVKGAAGTAGAEASSRQSRAGRKDASVMAIRP